MCQDNIPERFRQQIQEPEEQQLKTILSIIIDLPPSKLQSKQPIES